MNESVENNHRNTRQGIDGLPFTHTWLESVLQNALRTTWRLREVRCSEQPACQGLLSIATRAFLDWEKPKDESEELIGNLATKLPKSVFIKVISDKIMQETNDAGMDFGMDPETVRMFTVTAHQNECDFYTKIRPSDRNLAAISPRYYFSQPMDDQNPGIIILEDLTSSAVIEDILDGISLPQALAVVKGLARFHSWSLTSDEPLRRETTRKRLFTPEFLKASSTIIQLTVLPTVQNELAENANLLPNLNEAAIAKLFSAETVQKVLSAIDCEEANCRTLLTHGDLWSNNCMFRKRGADCSDELAAIIDWQLIFEGLVSEDIATLLACSCEAELRRKETDLILETYFASLQNCLSTSNSRKDNVPFGLSDVKSWYKLTFLLGLINLGLTLPVLLPKLVANGTSKIKQRRLVLRFAAGIEDCYQYLTELNIIS